MTERTSNNIAPGLRQQTPAKARTYPVLGLLAKATVVLERSTTVASFVLVYAMAAIVMATVVSRYIPNIRFIAGNEIIRHLTAAVAFLGLAYTLKKEGHTRVDVVLSRLSTIWRKRLVCLSSALGLVYVSILSIQAWLLTKHYYVMGIIDPDSHFKAYPFIIPMSLGLSVLSICLLARFLREVKSAVAAGTKH